MADDILGSFTQGVSGGLDLVSKAVDVHRKQDELAQKRKDVELQKFDSLMNDMNNIRIAPKGRVRDILIDKASQRQQIVGNIVDPGVWEAMRGDEYQVPLAKLLTHGRNMIDADERYDYMQASLPGVADAGTFLTGMSEMLMKGDTEMAKATKGKHDAAKDVLETTSTQIKDLHTVYKTQVDTINAANRINSLGATPVSRDNPAAKEAVKFLFQRLNDPGSTVRDGEYARAAGIGQSALNNVKNWADDFINGSGKFRPEQWRMVIEVANALGQGSQNDLSRAVAQKNDLYTNAGVKPEDVLKSVPTFTPFDFKSAGFKQPKGITTLEKHTVDKAMQEKATQAKAKIDMITQKLQEKGYSKELIDKLVARAKQDLADKKGTANGSTK